MKEIWKDIKRYEGLYQISNLGRVRSLSHYVLCKNNRTIHFCGKILSLSATRGGYLCVVLCKNGIPKTYRVNRLVAEEFVLNPKHRLIVDHIDGDRTNNYASNLRWVTHLENMNNPITKYKRAKTVLQIENNTIINIYPSVNEAKKITGICHIRSVCLKKRKTAGGYKWKFKE